ncbi:MAG: alpha/beta hydrolase [Thermovirgaceae bacterium]
MTSILDDPLMGNRYFFPRIGRAVHPFTVATEAGNLLCSYRHEHPGAATIVHFHGNGEIAADWEGELSEELHRRGFNCLLAEYRGYGGSEGFPALASMLDDVKAVVEASGEPKEKIVLFGRSLGSLYAIHGAATIPKIAGLVLESGIADVAERILLRVKPRELGTDQAGLLSEVKRFFDHETKLRLWNGPTLVLHSLHDGLVDVTHGERLARWAGDRAELKVFRQGDHNSIYFANQAEYLDLVTDFLTKVAG